MSDLKKELLALADSSDPTPWSNQLARTAAVRIGELEMQLKMVLDRESDSQERHDKRVEDLETKQARLRTMLEHIEPALARSDRGGYECSHCGGDWTEQTNTFAHHDDCVFLERNNVLII